MKKIMLPLLIMVLFLSSDFRASAHNNLGWESISAEYIQKNPTVYNLSAVGMTRFSTGTNQPFGGHVYTFTGGHFEFTSPKATDIEITYWYMWKPGEAKVFIDGELKGSFRSGHTDNINKSDQHFLISGLESKEHRVRVEIHSSTSYSGEVDDYMYINGFEFVDAAAKFKPIQNLTHTKTHNAVNLSWIKPDTNYDSVVIKRNGTKIATVNNSTLNYALEDLEPSTTYEFQLIAMYGEKASEPVTLTVTTDEPPPPQPAGEVTNLGATATYERVNLSWRLPESQIFQHVNIYRAAEQNSEFSIMAAPIKIFETNGTYFNDLTVQPETTYNYKLTTYSTEGVESEGVVKSVTTLEAPPPVIEGGSYTKDPLTGNFIYSWESPSYGQVRVMLGENLFATVDASLKKVSIPNNQMKYTPFGDPDITLIAVDGDKESDPVRPGKDGQESGDTLDQLKVPFTAQDLLDSGAGLFLIIGPFLLLSLAFLLVPKFRAAVMTAFNGKGEKDEVVKDGRSEREGRSYRENASDRNLRVPREKVERETRAPRQARGERG